MRASQTLQATAAHPQLVINLAGGQTISMYSEHLREKTIFWIPERESSESQPELDTCAPAFVVRLSKDDAHLRNCAPRGAFASSRSL